MTERSTLNVRRETAREFRIRRAKRETTSDELLRDLLDAAETDD